MLLTKGCYKQYFLPGLLCCCTRYDWCFGFGAGLSEFNWTINCCVWITHLQRESVKGGV